MNTVKRDGVAIAYQEVGSGSLPLLLVHGFACDHTFLAPQLAFFSRSHRTVAVDLRGHGMSDAPHQEYTMTGFADDLAWLCAELNLKQPVIVGHSMGGNIALELAARYPDLPAAIALIDSVVLPPPGFTEVLRPLAEDLKGPHYLNALERVGALLFLPTDDAKRKSRLLATMGKTQQHVISSAFRNHITEYDSTPTIKACRVPIAYISAAVSMASVDRFRELYPQLITGQTIGSGHFSPLEVPNQINAMLERFLEISLIRLREQFSPSTPDRTAWASLQFGRLPTSLKSRSHRSHQGPNHPARVRALRRKAHGGNDLRNRQQSCPHAVSTRVCAGCYSKSCNSCHGEGRKLGGSTRTKRL